MHEFEELYVASDLHLGGEDRFPIFTKPAGDAFLAFCKRIAKSKRRTGFVINGDLVDFLSEKNAAYFDSHKAVAKLERIAGDPSFEPVFDGLRAISSSPSCHLAITIGNHDIELALPWVREKLLELLAGDETARRRITLALDGTGYRCRVGGASVVCIHGNDVDTWNVNDYEAIRRTVRRATFGSPAPDWSPNAGTKLVVDVMNRLKEQYAFVNLLKPEVPAVLPILVALEPSVEGVVDDAVRIAGSYLRDAFRRATDLLGDSRDTMAAGHPDELLLAIQSANEPLPSSRDAEDIMRRTEERFAEGKDPYSLADEPGAQLGFAGSAYQWFRGNRTEGARELLERLAGDRSFDTSFEDGQAKALDLLVGSGADVVIAGHTHLERSHKRKDGGWYLNSGTWTLLMKLKEEHWKDAKGFEPAWSAIRQGSLEALYKAGMVVETRTVAAVRSRNGKVIAGLVHIGDSGVEQKVGVEKAVV